VQREAFHRLVGRSERADRRRQRVYLPPESDKPRRVLLAEHARSGKRVSTTTETRKTT
jgi:hypothetical protein